MAPARQKQKQERAPARRTRVMIKNFGPWSVLKFSLLYYFCVMLVVLVALTMLYNVLGALGTLESVNKLARNLNLGGRTFEVHGWWLLSRFFAIGLVMVVFWSLVKVFLSLLYNLISDLVGGVDLTLAERR
jgi:hypothetical protein